MTEDERMEQVAAEAVRQGKIVACCGGYVVDPLVWAALMTPGVVLTPSGPVMAVFPERPKDGR